MSKHDVLTQRELLNYQPGAATLWYLEKYRQQNALNKEDLNVLDWGCGRGRSVAYLREQGYNAYGVDIDPDVIAKGRPFFEERGETAEQILTLFDGAGNTCFADKFFHVTFSEAVFEHVRNLTLVANELKRVTRSGGIGIHSFPAHRHFIEAHLHMPLVHWLPKNHLRRQLINLFLHLGFDPDWPEAKNCSMQDKVTLYHQYSIDKTYYRKPVVIKRILEQNDFTVEVVTIDHPKLKQYRLANSPLRTIFNWVFSNFFLVVLLVVKR
ncbi:MAG: hypothetical protein FOGNACKC_00084 [Anaerolineae bacterium]|nr:hypothetical protein [Anaerolineae bacterium]